MDKDMFEDKWEQMKDDVQAKWEKLTTEDLNAIKGNARVLGDKLQEKYGMTKEVAEKAIEELKEKFKN